MNLFKDFVKYAVEKDYRNRFSIADVDISKLNGDELFIEFYSNYNPEDVEIDLGEQGIISFFSAEELSKVQLEYNCEGYFVFASIEGDPVAIKNGKIYLAPHGAGKEEYDFKKTSKGFIEFLKSLMNN
ncbi:MAG: hypothetical protein ACOCRU_00090 [bacterium]